MGTLGIADKGERKSIELYEKELILKREVQSFTARDFFPIFFFFHFCSQISEPRFRFYFFLFLVSID